MATQKVIPVSVITRLVLVIQGAASAVFRMLSFNTTLGPMDCKNKSCNDGIYKQAKKDPERLFAEQLPLGLRVDHIGGRVTFVFDVGRQIQ